MKVYKLLYRNRILSFLLFICLLSSTLICPVFAESDTDDEADTYSSIFGNQKDPFTGRTDEVLNLMQQVWDYLMEQYHNPYAVATIMANAHAESFFIPYRYESDIYPTRDGDFPDSLEYTEKVDTGEISRFDFANFGPFGGGYGLFAWTDLGRKEALYDFAKSRGVSISDWQMQLDFAYQEITDRYYPLYRLLLSSNSLYDLTYSFIAEFEKADSLAAAGKRLGLAQKFYERFSDSSEFISPFEKYDLLPINGNYRYLKEEIVSDVSAHESIYISMVQSRLIDLGYYHDEPDGTLGTYTQMAIIKFQTENGLAPTGAVGPVEWSLLAQDSLNTTMSEVWWIPEK